MDVVGIADKRFENHGENEDFLGYKAIAPEEILDIKPDYVVVATKFYINIVEDLYYNLLKGTKIKIKPLLKKTLVREVFNR